MAFRRRGEEDPPPDYSLNLDNFTVKFFHGGYWFTRGGNRKYENGRIAYLDFCNFNGFSRLQLEEMAQVLGYIFPFAFLFKTKGKNLNMGFRVVEESKIILMLDDLRGRNVGIYFTRILDLLTKYYQDLSPNDLLFVCDPSQSSNL
ncbi:hypothetical protein CsatB_014248 [Cannabis sativa]